MFLVGGVMETVVVRGGGGGAAPAVAACLHGLRCRPGGLSLAVFGAGLGNSGRSCGDAAVAGMLGSDVICRKWE
jgi:hypothetical protein